MIVFFFLFCNIGKLTLNIFDIFAMEKIETCMSSGHIFKYPTWVVAMSSLNHLLLVRKLLSTTEVDGALAI